MTNFLISGVLTFISFAALALFLTPALIRYLKNANHLDIPNHRSSHKIPVPSFGGLIFFPVVIILGSMNDWQFTGISSLILLSGVIGLADDKLNISPKKKLGLQLLVAIGLYGCGLSLNAMLSLMGLSIENSTVNGILTLLFIMAFMNAFNLIDGIDGLAGGIALISSSVFSVIFFLSNDFLFFLLTLAFCASIFVFLIFNFQPAKIFMGDTGSLLLGCYLTVCFLHVSSSNYDYLFIASSTLIYPLLDMIRLFLGRMLIFGKPFNSDQNHYHHLLLQNGFNHRKSTLLIYGLHLLIILSSIGLSNFATSTSSILLLLAISMIGFIFIQFLFVRTFNLKKREITYELTHQGAENHLIKKHLL